MLSFDNYLFALLVVLVPIFVYYSYFYKKEILKENSILFGILCCISIILSMTFSLELADGHIHDLRAIPWLLAFLYGGFHMGILATAVIIIYRFFIGFDDGFFVTIFSYFMSTITILWLINRYKLAFLNRKLRISFLLTLLNTVFVSIGIIYFFDHFDSTMLPKFIVYFIVSHIVTILIAVYIIETLQEKENDKVRLQQAERIRLVGEMAAAVAHEVRNPLTVVKGFLQLFKSDKNLTESQIGSLELMNNELQRAEKIIHDYLSLAKNETTNFEKIDVKEVIANVVDVMESYALLNGVKINNYVKHSYFINANRSELSQVFLNIIKNGIEAIENKGSLKLRARNTGGYVEIQISDTGKGMSEEAIQRLGSPFYTTKDQGTGLGTMVCYKIIANLNGKIIVKSKLQEGTTFSIVLPLIK